MRRQSPDSRVAARRRPGMGAVEPGLLRAAQQRGGLGCRRVVACLPASDRPRGRASSAQDRSLHPASLAPNGGAGPRSLAGMFLGLCVAQDAGRLDGPGRPGKQSTDRAASTGADPEYGRGGAHHGWAHYALALCRASGQGPDDTVESLGSQVAATIAAAARTGQNVVPTFETKMQKTQGISLFQPRNCGSWARVLSIADCGHNEFWLRDMIHEDPSILGLG